MNLNLRNHKSSWWICSGFYSIISINSEYQRLFFLPSTECHNSGAELASDVIEVLKNKSLSKNEIDDQLFEFSKTRCDTNIRELQNSLQTSILTSQATPTMKSTQTAVHTTLHTSKKENVETSATFTTSQMPPNENVFLLKIPKSNILEINADILIVSFLVIISVFVIMLFLLFCCCLSHLPSTKQYFKSNQVKNVSKRYDTEGITKVSI